MAELPVTVSLGPLSSQLADLRLIPSLAADRKIVSACCCPSAEHDLSRAAATTPNQERTDDGGRDVSATLGLHASSPCQVLDPGLEKAMAPLLEPVPVGMRQLVVEFVSAPRSVRGPRQAPWPQQVEPASREPPWLAPELRPVLPRRVLPSLSVRLMAACWPRREAELISSLMVLSPASSRSLPRL